MEVFREKSSSISTTVYSRTRQSCESLGTLFYAKSGGNVLVAVERELESVTNRCLVKPASDLDHNPIQLY